VTDVTVMKKTSQKRLTHLFDQDHKLKH